MHLRTRYSDIIQQKFSRARKIRQIHNNFCSPDSLTPAHIWIPPHPPSQNPQHNLNLHNTVSISEILEIFEKQKIHLKVIFSAQCQIFVVLVVLSCIFLNKSFQIWRTKQQFENKCCDFSNTSGRNGFWSCTYTNWELYFGLNIWNVTWHCAAIVDRK